VCEEEWGVGNWGCEERRDVDEMVFWGGEGGLIGVCEGGG
jgi:hypothetical protein